MSQETVREGHASTWYRWPRAVHLPSAAGVILSTWLLLSGGMLAIRRVTGATNPLEPAWLLAAGLLLAAIAWCIHWCRATAGRRAQSEPPAVVGVRSATALGLAMNAFGLAMNAFGLGAMSTAWWAGFAFWTLIVAEEVWAWKRSVGVFLAPPPNKLGHSHRVLVALRDARHWVRSMTMPAAPAGERSPASAPLADADDRVWQRYVRSLTDAGEDQVRGTLRVAFVAGARTATAHVAFCPPFAERPRFEANQTAGPTARFKVAQILPQGARLELRLPAAAAGGERVDLSFTAVGHHLA